MSLSETAAELEAGAKSHGWDLIGIEVIELIANESQLEDDEQLTMLPVSEVELSETTRGIIDAVNRGVPTRMALDSLSELRILAKNSLRYRRQILALKQFFSGRKCTVLLLDDRTSEGHDLQLHSIAHGVISLDSHSPSYGQRRRELEVIKLRGSDFVSGRHDFSIRQIGLTIFPRSVSADHSISFERGANASGVVALDMFLGGGVERGTSTLFINPPGSGESTIAIQYAVAATQRGDHAAAFLFDEIKATMLARSAGIGTEIKEGLGAGDMAIQQIDSAAISPGEFADLVRSSVIRGARVVVIDSLNGYLNSVPHGSLFDCSVA